MCCCAVNQNETPVERELRLRQEAKDRLRAKFGSNGLKGASVSSHPMPRMDDDGPGFNADVLQKKGEEALNSLSTAFSSFGSAALDATNKAAQSLKEAEIGKKLNDAENLQKLKASTAQSWSALQTGASSLWSKVKESGTGDSVWNTLNEIAKPVSNTGRDQELTEKQKEDLRLEKEAKERLKAKFGGEGLKGFSGFGAASTPPAHQNDSEKISAKQPAPSADSRGSKSPRASRKEDDDQWLLEQLANTTVAPRSSSTPPRNRAKKPSAISKLQVPERPSSVAGTKPEGSVNSSPAKAKAKPPRPAGDDFFSSFGVK